ncbi:FAD:protein FMN transferase [Sporotomaculum syntrophicum]|nr:FAD:protein FMN transferase [Sporotomaculum syntrophicum]
MDTLVHITVFCEDEHQGKKALDEAFTAFERISHLTDRFNYQDKTTPLSGDVIKVNNNAGNSPVRVSDDTLTILKRSNYFSELSGGAFDVTIGPLMDLWGFGSNRHEPEQEEINEALTLVDYEKIKIDYEQGTVFLPKSGMLLDLGGVAKGYATDQAVSALRKLDVNHAIINAGGNVYALGTKPDGALWRVGVQDPRGDGLIAIISVQDAAVVTSGDYQRYFIQGGARYHHILDPATGRSARDAMQVTVVGDSAMDADILSTTLFVLGSEKGFDMVTRLENTEVVFVRPDKQILYSDTLSKNLTFTGDGGYQLDAK